MVRAVRYAGKVYQNEMARAVQQLGYGIRLVRQNGEITGFEIEGVSDALCERFSKRREEIERQIEKFEEKQGRKPTVKEIALITRETRPAALKEIATAEVLAFQRSQLSPEEWQAIAESPFTSGSPNDADSALVRSARRFAPVSRISLSAAASCANTRFWPKLSTSRSARWILGDLKQAASNGESRTGSPDGLAGKPVAL